LKRILHSIIILFVVCLFSCNSTEKQKKEVAKEAAVPIGRKVEVISPIEKRSPGISIAHDLRPAFQFQYTTSVTKKIGEFVEGPVNNAHPATIGFENTIVADVKENQNELPGWKVFPVMVNIIFDNDIFNNTDYYYTNGARIELVFPAATSSPVNKVLAGLKTNDIDVSGFSLTQNIYTPVNPESTEIVYGDRPFAAYLTVGQFRESYHLKKRLQIKSAIDLGVMGPMSLGEQVQSTVHELEPSGWKYQVQNSFLINYYVGIEKGLYSSSNLELNAVGHLNVGSLYDKLGGGLRFRVGSFLPVYRGPMTICCDRAKKGQLQYWFFMSGKADFIAYDATLQGSMFNDQSPYVISSNELNRVVYQGSVGVALYYDNLGVELENFYLSPEFEGAHHFKYGRIKLVANF